MSRAKNTLGLWVDGNYVGGGSDTADHQGANINICGTETNVGQCHNGYVDDLRISVGVARQSSRTYTVPTGPY